MCFEKFNPVPKDVHLYTYVIFYNFPKANTTFTLNVLPLCYWMAWLLWLLHCCICLACIETFVSASKVIRSCEFSGQH